MIQRKYKVNVYKKLLPVKWTSGIARAQGSHTFECHRFKWQILSQFVKMVIYNNILSATLEITLTVESTRGERLFAYLIK